ncbi:hypothetical protein SK128_013888 [Halocaridina rubra]|uniref:Uncharacterized protein n=1 Tax=Halocaridina rubra TaxID=373956 RepID=A0AAN9A3L4_HALRR
MLHVCEGNSNVMVDTQPAWREAPKLDCDSESNEGPSHSPGHDDSQDIIATLDDKVQHQYFSTGAELQDRVSAEVGRYTKSVKQILECLEPTSKNYQYTMLRLIITWFFRIN